MDVSDAVAEYLAYLGQRVKRRQMREQTSVGYRQRLSVFASWCAGQQIPLEQVRNKVVDDFLAHLLEQHKPHRKTREQLSSHTLAGYGRVISAFLHWCSEDEEFEECVKPMTLKRIKPVKTELVVIETLSVSEIEVLLEACKKERSAHLRLRDEAILFLLLDTGVRANELCTLSIGNTVLRPIEDAHIRVFGKGQKWREVPLGTKARRKMQQYVRAYRQGAAKDEPTFISRYHQALTVNGLEQLVQRLGEKAALSQIHPHKFRHTFAREFMKNGGDVYDLSRLMGHESVSTTEEYLKALTGQDVRRRKLHQSVLDNL